MISATRLAELVGTLGDETLVAMEELDPNDPEDVSFLAEMQDVFTALRELEAWRHTYPSVVMTQLYVTPFGVQRLQ